MRNGKLRTIESIERGKRIKQIRTDTCKTNQKEFGKLLGGLGISTVSGWETGSADPGPDIWIKIAELGNVSLDWLLTGKDKKQPNTISIESGNSEASKRLTDQSKRATVKSPNLQLIVQWMDEEFGKHERQGLFFYDDIRDRYESFEKFLGKKRTSEGHSNRELEDLSDGTQG